MKILAPKCVRACVHACTLDLWAPIYYDNPVCPASVAEIVRRDHLHGVCGLWWVDGWHRRLRGGVPAACCTAISDGLEVMVEVLQELRVVGPGG